MLQLFFVIIIVFAILAIQTNKLRRAVIYLGVFSLACSFCYLLYNAPDVAIAEAVISSTLATILYLVALKKYRVFTIYYTSEGYEIETERLQSRKSRIIKTIENFCVTKELVPQVVYTTETEKQIKTGHQYDLIVKQNEDGILLHGNKKNYQLSSLQEYIQKRRDKSIVSVVYEDKEGE